MGVEELLIDVWEEGLQTIKKRTRYNLTETQTLAVCVHGVKQVVHYKDKSEWMGGKGRQQALNFKCGQSEQRGEVRGYLSTPHFTEGSQHLSRVCMGLNHGVGQ